MPDQRGQPGREGLHRPRHPGHPALPRQHLGFGAGIHTCIGKQLARMELEVVYGTLFRRIPGLRLAVPFDEVVFRNTFDVQGAKALPVTW
ncbi:cytochrome P450 [Kutzneria chonburiensis]|uniref:cytochrome P450 n=1 Tax=Kutzneria chonburiensis TaxID=1483604 RepID=UPI0023606691|nr:cytochrome P450 [Kutzneria chonburiensis]